MFKLALGQNVDGRFVEGIFVDAFWQMRTLVDAHFCRCALQQMRILVDTILVDGHFSRQALWQMGSFVEGLLVDDHFVEGCLVDGHFGRGSFCRRAF